MTNAIKKHRSRLLASAAVVAAVTALALTLGAVVGCAPTTAAPLSEEEIAAADPMFQQILTWTADSECEICHKVEDASLQNADCPQASGHADLECVQCHTEESTLKTAHDGVAYNDVPADEATVVTVDPATCQDPACHGTLEEMAVKTADLDTFKDEKGKVQDPHEYESNEQHDAHQPVCTDCHKIHSEELQKDAMMWCAQCHHKGVFQCGTCHELRERAV